MLKRNNIDKVFIIKHKIYYYEMNPKSLAMTNHKRDGVYYNAQKSQNALYVVVIINEPFIIKHNSLAVFIYQYLYSTFFHFVSKISKKYLFEEQARQSFNLAVHVNMQKSNTSMSYFSFCTFSF